jgi:signal transduction histidine kinase
MSSASQPARNDERPAGQRGTWPPAPDQGGSAYELAAALAHDLRSPVAAIQIVADAILEGGAGPLNAEQRRRLTLIRSAAFSLCALACDVEDLARGNLSPLDGEPVPFSIRELFADVQGLVAPLQEARGVAMRFDAPLGRPDYRLGRPGALRRILLNLATNALHAADQGAVQVAAVPRDQRRVEFSVTDNGPGLDPRTLAAGLGLKICQNLADALESTIEMTSRPGIGTCVRFTIDLPLAPTAELHLG